MSDAARTPVRPAEPAAFDVETMRREFPVLARRVHGHPLAYLDNGASSQAPRRVIEAVDDYARSHHANVHRGVHTLSEEATARYEGARDRVARWLNAASRTEIVFTRGTTEAVNLVAQSYARPQLRAGDEVLITHLEHHANIVPWQMVCEQTGAKLVVAPIDERGELDPDAVEALMGPRTRVFACAHVSNALGTVLPVERLVASARARGIATLVDGAQAVPHGAVDVRALGCDFYAFSGHKMYAPTGIGALYGRESMLERMPPWQGGGDMILTVSFERTTYNALPYKFEAGTPNIADAVAFGPALDYLSAVGLDAIRAHEDELAAKAVALLEASPSVFVLGPKDPARRSGVVSFNVAGLHPHDVGTIFDLEGVAVRVGHHCAQPVHRRFGVAATSRASAGVYTTDDEVEAFREALSGVRAFFGLEGDQ